MSETLLVVFVSWCIGEWLFWSLYQIRVAQQLDYSRVSVWGALILFTAMAMSVAVSPIQTVWAVLTWDMKIKSTTAEYIAGLQERIDRMTF